MPGYCRKTEDGWSYSPAAIELVKSFTARFPALFEYLQNKPKEDKYYESELFGGADRCGLGVIHIYTYMYVLVSRRLFANYTVHGTHS